MEKQNKNSAARIAANNRYNAKTYGRINLAVPKGDKEKYKAAAEAERKSLNQFIVDCIEDKISRE